MPLKLKNAASLKPRPASTVEALGITIPVFPYFLAAEKLNLAALEGDLSSPTFVLKAFCIFTEWRCPPEDRADFDTLSRADLDTQELNELSQAVATLLRAASGSEEEEPEGKAKKTTRRSSTTTP